jgi:hypothetical protein
MRFDGRIQLLENNQIAGAAVYNPLARAIKHVRSLSPFLLVGVTPAGGLSLDLDLASIMGGLDREMPFSCVLDGSRLAVAGGIVWLCDRRLDADGREFDLDGPTSVWVRIAKGSAEIRSGKDFPPALDVSSGRCNWPVAAVERERDGTFVVMARHVGDIVVLTMPHIFLPGYDAGRTLVRICRNGIERYVETGECEEDDE